MNKILRFCFTLVLGLTAAGLRAAGNLKVTLGPVSAVSAGAQWRVDAGTWQNSGATVKGLTSGTHNVGFKTVSGWIAPAAISANIANGSTISLTAAYIQAARLSISLAPNVAQWRVDQGVWQNSGATVTNLTPGNHAVEYSSVPGYQPAAAETVTLTAGNLTTLQRSYVQYAQLSVTLAPGIAQWRANGGAWQSSGATVSLLPGSYTVDYSTVAGYIAPGSETVSLAAGQALAWSRDYVQLAQIAVTLSPGVGQWRLDGGAWQASGATLANLNPGTHLVDYSSLGGYIAPPSENVVLNSGQTLALQRAYIQLAAINVTLSLSSAQWRIDGGAWQSSGATVANLTPGSHALEYSAAAYYTAPAAETVTLNPGDSLALQRTYVRLAQIGVGLSPSTGQWRANGGAWQPAGGWLWVPAGTYTIEFSPLAGYTAPPNETVTVDVGGVFATTRYYTSQKPTLQISLQPSTGEWRLDGGAWRASGSTVSEIEPGTHTIDYSDVGGEYAPLAAESITLNLLDHVSLTRAYHAKPAQITVTTSPSTGGWAIHSNPADPTESWNASGATVTGLAPGTYYLSYQPLAGYTTPSVATLTLAAGEAKVVTTSYTPESAQLTVNLYPNTAQWSVDGGPWLASGATLTTTPNVAHTIAYLPLAGYIAPAAETVTLSTGQPQNLYRFYNPLAKVTVTLYPTTARWRVDGGSWQASGATVSGLASGDHTLDYEPLTGYVAASSETINVYAGQDTTFYRYYQNVPQFHVTLTPSTAQWRVDGGSWQNSDTTAYVTAGAHTIEYSSVAGYITPSREMYQLYEGEIRTVSTQYVAAGRVSLTLTPANAQWQVDGGPWQPSGAIVDNLWPGYHRIDYSDVTAYITPGYEMLNIPGGQLTSLSRTYTAVAQISITTYPSSTRWRVNGGEWYLNGMTYTLSQGGNYTIDYLTPDTYQPIPSEVVTLPAGQLVTLTRYSPSVTSANAGQLIIHANPGSIPNSYAQFAVDLSTYMYAGWYTCGQTVPLPAGRHSIFFAQGSVGWQEPAPFDVDIVAGATTELTVTFHPTNHVRYFVDQSLAGAMTNDELVRRLSQYSADLNTIFSRESLRRIQFDSYYDVNVVTQDPFTNPPYDFYPQTSLWVYLRATDNLAIGTYGGQPALHASGAAGGTDFRWDQIYDPATLTAGSPQMEQYWRQLHYLTRVFELSFGAGAGEYASLAGMKDLSGTAPLAPDTGTADSATTDPFWTTRSDYWADPLTTNAWNNPRLGSPVARDSLLAAVHFAPLSSKLVSENARGADRQAATLPDLTNVAIHVVDAQTGQPIANAAVRVWNRSDPVTASATFEETVMSAGNGGFSFSWTDAASALTSAANAKLIKASATGYAPAVQWVTIYDAQKAKVIDGSASFDVTVTLTPQ